MEKEKKTILSAIKPTGTLNLGGYLGAMKNLGWLCKTSIIVFIVSPIFTL